MPDGVMLRTHVVLIPGFLAVAALLAHLSGLDQTVSGWFFDPTAGGFPVRRSALLELLGHRLANALVIVVFAGLASAGVAAAWWQPLRRYGRLLLTTAAALAAGPMLVVALKSVTTPKCPWSLVQYGGLEQATRFGFTSPAAAGSCFPGGHAAGGFALVAIYFAGKVAGNRRLERSGLLLVLLAGPGFSLVRIAQGAHFLSHNLWSAAICWALAALVFQRSSAVGGERLQVPASAAGAG